MARQIDYEEDGHQIHIEVVRTQIGFDWSYTIDGVDRFDCVGHILPEEDLAESEARFFVRLQLRRPQSQSQAAGKPLDDAAA